MKPATISLRRTLLLAGLGLLALPAYASDRERREDWRITHPGHGGKRKHSKRDDRDDDDNRRQGLRQHHFEERHRVVVSRYYVQEYRHGHCPPGLARKHNGCLPPGQFRHWQMGRPLAREVIYHEVPPALIVQLGTPPRGYRYVRVASDILLIAIGTAIVVDALEDLIR